MSSSASRTRFCMLIGLALALVVLPSAIAHHASDNSYNTGEVIRLEGVIKHFEWINPHTVFHVEAPDPQGRMRQWLILGGTPNSLLRNGINRQVINGLLPTTTLNIGGVSTSSGSSRPTLFRGYFPVGGYCNPDCILLGEEITLAGARTLKLGNLGLDTLRVKP